jgi:hypothetical protein
MIRKAAFFFVIYLIQIVFLMYVTTLIYDELKPNSMIAIGSMIAILTTFKLVNITETVYSQWRLKNSKNRVKLNTPKIAYKKIFAFELLILLSSCVVCFIILYPLERRYDNIDNSNYALDTQIDSLKAKSIYHKRYEWLKYHYTDMESYETYKNNIQKDTDSTYQRYIYDLLERSDYADYSFSLEECITGYRNTLEISIDSKIAKLNAMKVKDPRELLNAAEYLISVLLIMVYPLRYLFYVVRWALRTLKEEH